MIEFVLAGIPLLLLLLTTVQLSLLWIGKSAVDTAAHLAARKFARVARSDFPKAREAAFAEALRNCRNRPDASLGSVSMTTLDIRTERNGRVAAAFAGEALRLRLTHGVELIVPWVNRILFLLSPGEKLQLGNRYYLLLQSERWVTVE